MNTKQSQRLKQLHADPAWHARWLKYQRRASAASQAISDNAKWEQRHCNARRQRENAERRKADKSE